MGNSNMKITRPLLAETADQLDQITLPCLASPKLDGYRCLKIKGEAVSRNFKPIRNVATRDKLKLILPEGIDGELMLKDSSAQFNEISSAFSAFEGEPDFIFHAFDYVKEDIDKPYSDRLEDLNTWLKENPTPEIKIVATTLIRTMKELEQYSEGCLDEGYEGSMYRKVGGQYKCGRSTLKEQILIKFKPWSDSEGIIVGFTEQVKNENKKEVNELGLTKRSSKKEGKIAANTLGNFLIIDPKFPGQQLEVGTGKGLTKELRQEIWNNQSQYLNKIIKYQYQLEGTKDKPRFPSWQGFRDISDLDEVNPILKYI